MPNIVEGMSEVAFLNNNVFFFNYCYFIGVYFLFSNHAFCSQSKTVERFIYNTIFSKEDFYIKTQISLCSVLHNQVLLMLQAMHFFFTHL